MSKPATLIERILGEVDAAPVGINRHERTLRALQHMVRGYERVLQDKRRKRPGRPATTFSDLIVRARFEDERRRDPAATLTEARKATAKFLGLRHRLPAEQVGHACKRIEDRLLAQTRTAWSSGDLLAFVRGVTSRLLTASAPGANIDTRALYRDLDELLNICGELDAQWNEARQAALTEGRAASA
ncbi:hypothetical protein [Alsobacter soli]|uniref:hypothetical protein n=1 Tax=Alsobacter soli TaxID=2109933 RepID=UPI0011B2255B|nr:hypothetical protein [Alsobacter soli]